MPQKTRKEKERAAQRRESGLYKRPVAPPPIEAPAPEIDLSVTRKTPAPVARRPVSPPPTLHMGEAGFNYSYVYADLRRIALLALLCFGIMVVLVFVLNR